MFLQHLRSWNSYRIKSRERKIRTKKKWKKIITKTFTFKGAKLINGTATGCSGLCRKEYSRDLGFLPCRSPGGHPGPRSPSSTPSCPPTTDHLCLSTVSGENL